MFMKSTAGGECQHNSEQDPWSMIATSEAVNELLEHVRRVTRCARRMSHHPIVSEGAIVSNRRARSPCQIAGFLLQVNALLSQRILPLTW